MQHSIDARGDQCPIPLIKAKKALKTLKAGDCLTVVVDNEISMQNLLKMAEQLKIKAKGTRQDTDYQTEFFYGGELFNEADSGEEERCDMPVKGPEALSQKKTVVVIASDKMGSGKEELGSILMKGFLYALAGLEELPSTLLFYNSGVRLTCSPAETIGDLKELEARGVEILSCGTCLDYYQLKDSLAAGSITNMYTIVERQIEADRIIRP